MQRDDNQESQILGAALIVSGAILATSGAICAFAAANHMAIAANLCGPTTGHCILCAVSAASLLAAAATAATGVALLRVRSYRSPQRAACSRRRMD
ncbi:hypothetical protein [Brevundimonas sp.]|uniref:hypothetical protein n=1 Tax=Brevundimonas sp. TaxID=1871086 RepID=UPI002BB4B8DB|nr:hypothetical protein [Brevundimonas sp.]HWQ87111.1 hypothetical protein [Brevundimonas sp.]